MALNRPLFAQNDPYLRGFCPMGRSSAAVSLRRRVMPSEDASHSHQVIGCEGERCMSLHPLKPPVLCFPKAADGFGPTEDFFDSFANFQALPVTGMARRSRINGRALNLLSHVRGDLHASEGRNELSYVISFVRPGSGFTLLMDALVLTLAKKLPVSAIAQMFGVSENRIWRAININIESARQATSYSEVTALGVDEKYVGRRLGYLSIFHDPIARRVIGTAEGRKADTFETFKTDFENHEGHPETIKFITMDMSKSFQAGARKQFPEAEICFDAFHISQLIHDAVDEVRRAEVKQDASLKGSRWGLLKSPKDWSKDQITDMHWLQRSGLKTARAWRMKQRYKEIHLMCRAGGDPEPLYRSWISRAKRSRLEPFKRLGRTLKAHLPGILAAYRLGASNAVAENINSQIQAAIVWASGFKSFRSLTNIIFLTVGKLAKLPANPFQYPVPV